jgi:hypothetical protein
MGYNKYILGVEKEYECCNILLVCSDVMSIIGLSVEVSNYTYCRVVTREKIKEGGIHISQ